MARLPVIACLLAAACVLPLLGGEALAAHWAFTYADAHLLHALTAQWVHWSTTHAFFNAVVLAICAGRLELRIGRPRLMLAILSASCVVAGLLFALANLDSYRGASGLAACLATLCVITFSARHRPAQIVAIGSACALVLSLPAWLGHGSGTLPAGVRPVWEIHFALALAATMMALASRSPLPGTGEGQGRGRS
jgi:membrane associated rhomboid family serine protease